MKIPTSKNRRQGLTLVELLVVMVVIALFASFVFSGAEFSNAKPRALRIQCVVNLKQTGLASRIWADDNNGKFPMQVPQQSGGAMEITGGLNAFGYFEVMSNELSTPKFLFCPAEADRHRFVATNFNLSNSNLTYFIGLDAIETNGTLILYGDHNITNGKPIRNGLLALTTNVPAGWTSDIHNKMGNILLADGSVQQESMTGLRYQIATTGVATNRVQMPVLGP
jgi:prepilin-type N-terminal cleavage/methylation domain-containing protein/prepilin-type processing-associated H-X9-DG protein